MSCGVQVEFDRTGALVLCTGGSSMCLLGRPESFCAVVEHVPSPVAGSLRPYPDSAGCLHVVRFPDYRIAILHRSEGEIVLAAAAGRLPVLLDRLMSDQGAYGMQDEAGPDCGDRRGYFFSLRVNPASDLVVDELWSLLEAGN